MKKFIASGCITAFSILATATTALAQTAQTAQTAPIFTPRVGVRYTTEGAGFESFSTFEGFLPVFQTPGNNLTFLQGRVLLDNDSNVATNILLGHRFFSEQENRVTGGYISFSSRDTGSSNFEQLGLGFETLGSWDLRLNAYLPLNNSEKFLSQSASGLGFQGNSLILGRQRLFEVALSGVDAEVGTRLATLGAGDLRGFAGIYYYSGGESREAFGWKTRIEARPTDYFNMGLSLQHDELFDTRLVFTVGANFPGSQGRGTKPNKNSALLRMAESVERQATILVTNEIRDDSVVAVGTNGQPLTIIYVKDYGIGNGTFENPFGTVTDATEIAKENNIIYVISDTSTTFAPFKIPDGVQVLSSGIQQVVNTQEFGTITLPGSGTGIHPIIIGSVGAGEGVVTLGNNTVLSGFNIQVQGGDGARGIQGTNISNVRLEYNKISNAFGQGIYLENIGGTATINSTTINNTAGDAMLLSQVGLTQITNNIISNAGGQGIQITNASDSSNISGNTISNVTGNAIQLAQVTSTQVTNNTINNTTANGITITEASDSSNISGNTISNVTGDGIQLAQVTSTQITNNNITETGGEGIQLENANGATNVSGNTISDAAGDAIQLSQITTAQITNNTITNAGGEGIQLENASDATNVSGNTINNATGDGIQLSQVASTQINNNNITETGDQGISLENVSGTSNIALNTISETTGDGIQLSQIADAQITNNFITNAGGEGIQVENASGTSNISLNTISSTGGDGIQLSQVTSSSVTNNQITNAGNQGIAVESASGNTNISNNTITDAQQEAINLSEVTGTVNVNQNTVNGNNNTSGIVVNNTSGTTDLTVNGNTLSANFNDIQVSLSETTGTLQVNDNIISNSGTAVDLQLGENTNLTSTTINNNQITGVETASASRGINLQAYNNADVGNVAVSGNTISNMINEDGMSFQLNNNSTGTFNISNNNISNIQDTSGVGSSLVDGIMVEVFDDAKADVTVANNTISEIPVGNAIYMQFFGGDNVGNLAITDNTISQITIQGNGIDLQFFDNFDPNINLNATVNIARNNISDIQGSGINAFNETSENTVNLTADANIISNTSRDAIKLEGFSTAQVTNNNITNAGEQGIEVVNGSGVNVTGNKITDAQQEGIKLSEVTGTVNVNQNNVNGNNNTSGIVISNSTGATDLAVNGNTLWENFNDIQVSLTETTGTLQVNDNIISNSGTAVDVQLATNTNLTSTTINNNQITGLETATSSQGINLQAFDAAAGTVEATGNTINTMTNGDGMNFQLNGTSTATFNIAGNIISNIQDTDPGDFNLTEGINVEIFDDAKADITVANNNISQIPTGNGVYMQFAGGDNVGTLNITDNTISQITTAGNGIDLQFFDNFDPNININATVNIARNNISDVQGTGINAFNETPDNTINLMADANTISNTSGDGIKLEGITNAQVTGKNNITNAGEQGIEVVNADGTTNISGNTITNAQQESIRLSNVTGNVTVNQNNVTGGKTVASSIDNIEGIDISNSSGNVTLTVNGNTLSENSQDISVNLSGTTTGTVEINNNTINNLTTGVNVQLTDDVNLTSININNNQITGVNESITSQGITLQAVNNLDAGGNFIANNVAVGNITVSGNNISNTVNGDGMNFQVGGNSSTTFTISGNTISNIQDTETLDINFVDGMKLEAFENANVTFNVTSQNTISQITNGNGISMLSFNNANTEFNISNLSIRQITQGTAIYLELTDDADGVSSNSTVNITNNNISDSTATTPITVSNFGSAELNVNFNISGNQITNINP